MITPMHTMRSGSGNPQEFILGVRVFLVSIIIGAAVINQYIYVIGGYDGAKQLNTVERYDTEHDVWEFVASMKIARSALSVTVLDCKIYAMGKLLVLSTNITLIFWDSNFGDIFFLLLFLHIYMYYTIFILRWLRWTKLLGKC